MIKTEEQLKRDVRELAFSIVDMITDYVDSKDYDESEEATVVTNTILMLTSFPLEYVSPSDRPRIIEMFSDFAREQMTAFNVHLRKENHEGN